MNKTSRNKTNEIVIFDSKGASYNQKPKTIKIQEILKKDWKVLLGIVGTLLGIFGGLITIDRYFSETPKLATTIIKMEFKLDERSFFKNLIKQLEGIEEQYTKYTDYAIEDLISTIHTISESYLRETTSEEKLSQ